MSARDNLSTSAEIHYSDLIGQGSFKNVYGGSYLNGPRKNQPCVIKAFRDGPRYISSAFDHDMEIIEKTEELLSKFNALGIINRKIFVNRPGVWVKNDYHEEKMLVEPYIKNFEKFNSNSGWVSRKQLPWCEVMQALSHFSYHTSGGQFLLCDIQGGIYAKGAVLTDPVVLSRNKRFGPTDLGGEGMISFFSNHSCNKYCESHWQRPKSSASYVPVRKGTSMMAKDGRMIVPTRKSRPPMSNFHQPIYEEHENSDYYSD